MGRLARHLGQALAVALVGLWPSVMVAAEAGCAAPAPVCAARAAVFAVSAFDPMASAVRVAPDLLVTNRHVVADDPRAEVHLPDGGRLSAEVVPSSYPGDLALLRVEGLPSGPILPIVPLDPQARLHSVAAERGRIRAYGEGRVILAPAPAKPLARLHHSAYSQPGNSGGALVDAAGRLVAIVTSGGEGRNEAIPAREIARLRAMSGAGHLVFRLI